MPAQVMLQERRGAAWRVAARGGGRRPAPAAAAMQSSLPFKFARLRSAPLNSVLTVFYDFPSPALGPAPPFPFGCGRFVLLIWRHGWLGWLCIVLPSAKDAPLCCVRSIGAAAPFCQIGTAELRGLGAPFRTRLVSSHPPPPRPCRVSLFLCVEHDATVLVYPRGRVRRRHDALPSDAASPSGAGRVLRTVFLWTRRTECPSKRKEFLSTFAPTATRRRLFGCAGNVGVQLVIASVLG